jgi:hypothetical protein
MDPHSPPPDPAQPPLLGTGEPEPMYPPDLPPAAPGAAGTAVGAAPRRNRIWLWVAALVLAAGTVVAVVLLLVHGGSSQGRGADTAERAAQQFVVALNAGDKQAAADISCDGFQDQARSEAVSGADPSISFHLEEVRRDGDTALARISQHFELPDGTPPQVQPIVLDVIRSGGRWLVCGTA